MIGQIQGNSSVAAAQALETSPDDFARRTQLVEVTRSEVAKPARQNVAIQIRGGERQTLQLFDHVQQTVQAAAWLGQPLPAWQEAGQRARRHGFHLLAEASQRAAFEGPQHFGVAPFAARSRQAGTPLPRPGRVRPAAPARYAPARLPARAGRRPVPLGTARAFGRSARRGRPADRRPSRERRRANRGLRRFPRRREIGQRPRPPRNAAPRPRG